MTLNSQPDDSALTWDAVIATRNRPEALALSIPLLLKQTRLPQKIIVIDSSDDHAPIRQIVTECTQGWDGEVIVHQSGPGLPYQRNRGLEHVSADVVIFPDDDSLFYTDTAAEIMAIYEMDRAGIVAGVCGISVHEAPEGSLPEGTYQMSRAHARDARTRLMRNRIEKKLSHLKPALYLGGLFKGRHPVPDWFDPERHSLVEYMTGFRMSFRTQAIKAREFDENLKGYGLDEDVEASLAVARDGLLVGARRAQVYHHKNPSGRAGSFTMGAIAVLNRAYVILKHTSDGALTPQQSQAARSRLRWFIRLKLLTELRYLRSAPGRARWRGAFAAARASRTLMRTPRAELGAAYSAAQDTLTS
ncbi:glycosyltransferase family 2 protein [Roseobacter sp.]|uniref:glycosyltransferase family A protein n=1 Tax=Roseobacter sp. TaxID=1907202 RepID=UPI003297C7CB